MLTEFGYLLAWGVYLVCATGLYWSLSVLFRRLGPKIIQYIFRSLVAVLLFTPAVSVPEQNIWAPAYLVSVYSYVQDEQYLATQAALFMLAAWCIIGLLLALAYVVSKLRQHSSATNAPEELSTLSAAHLEGQEYLDNSHNVEVNSEKLLQVKNSG